MKQLRQIADNRQVGTIATRMRQKRFELFKSLIDSVPRPVSILDVGGTQTFWHTMGYLDEPGVTVTLLNLEQPETNLTNFIAVTGDATDMKQFADGEFDVVFSNSVIEHVGGPKKQKKMAQEVQRVGRRYFVQTPNRFFPIEPHFLFPLFQFLPLSIRAFLIQRFSLGWYPRIPDRTEATNTARSIRLLSGKEVRSLFPEATIYEEKLLWLTKSFVAYAGFD